MLLRVGWIGEADLRAALQRQENEGGRIGTCLLDSGRVDEPTLLAALGAQQRLATIDLGRRREIREEEAELLPLRVALQTQSVPLGLAGEALEVAMIDAGSLELVDRIESCVRRRVVPYLGLEIRVLAALESLYSVEVSERHRRTRARLEMRQRLTASAPPRR
jgi:hypothetical protein